MGFICAVEVLRQGQLVSTVTLQDVTGDCFKPAALATLILGFTTTQTQRGKGVPDLPSGRKCTDVRTWLQERVAVLEDAGEAAVFTREQAPELQKLMNLPCPQAVPVRHIQGDVAEKHVNTHAVGGAAARGPPRKPWGSLDTQVKAKKTRMVARRLRKIMQEAGESSCSQFSSDSDACRQEADCFQDTSSTDQAPLCESRMLGFSALTAAARMARSAAAGWDSQGPNQDVKEATSHVRDDSKDIACVTLAAARVPAVVSHGMWAATFATHSIGRGRHRQLLKQWRSGMDGLDARTRQDMYILRNKNRLSSMRPVPDYVDMDSLLPEIPRGLLEFVVATRGPLDGHESDGGMYAPYRVLRFYWMHFAAGNMREKIEFDSGRVLVVDLAGQKSASWEDLVAQTQQWEPDDVISFLHERHRDENAQGRLVKHLLHGITLPGVEYVRYSSAPNEQGNFLVTVMFDGREHAQGWLAHFSANVLPKRVVRVRVALDAGMYVGIDARADYNAMFTRSTISLDQKIGMFTIFTIGSALLGDLSHSNSFNTMVWAEYPGTDASHMHVYVERARARRSQLLEYR